MSELWTPGQGPAQPKRGPDLFGPRKHVAKERVVTLPSGERVRVWVDDSDTVTQVEHDHSLDAIVRPKTIRVKWRRE